MNRPHVELSSAPVNIGTGLRSGRYIAQVHRESDPGTVLYATAPAPPADPADWFSVEAGEYFVFGPAPMCPTWARTADRYTVAGNAEAHASLAIADFKP